MKSHRIFILTILIGLCASVQAETTTSKWGAIPLSFEPNQGQTDSKIRYISRGSGYGLYFTDTEAIVAFTHPQPATVRMRLIGQNPSAAIEPLDVQPGVSHYFVGSDPAAWQGTVSHFGRLRRRSVYPGIDLDYYGNSQQLEYDFTVSPGSNPQSIALEFSGAQELSISGDGDLVLGTPAGKIRHQRPIAYQKKDGVVRPVSAKFVVRAGNRVGFEIGSYDPDVPLVIDPVLVYSSYFGGTAVGTAGDQGNAITVDAAGNAYVTGFTTSTDFLSGLAKGQQGGAVDAFVMKLSSDGTTLISASYLGGSGSDEGHDIALDAAGNIFITGYTSSPNFPRVNAIQNTLAGLQDAFIVKFNSDASSIAFSTYLGGSLDDRGLGIAVDSTGNVYVTGLAGSRDFPTRNPFQSQYGGGLADAFVTKLSPAGAIVYSTYIGGVGHDQAYDIAVDSDGEAIITGFTTSINYPLQNAIVTAFRGGADDAIITKLNAAGSALVFSSYLGGSGSDNGVRVAVDHDQNILFTGYTASTNFPVTLNAFQLTPGGEFDAFLVKLSADGQSVEFSTYLGADGSESGVGLALDPTGNIYVAGFTSSFQFYNVNPVQRLLNNGAAVLTRDAFVMKFTPDLSQILFSTYLGGVENDGAVGLAVDADGNAYVTGYTLSDNFPLANAFQPQRNGGQDGFIAKINSQDIKTSTAFQFSTQGGVSFVTDAGTTSPQFGYAVAEVNPGAPAPTGLAITGLTQLGQLVSEVGLPVTPLTEHGRMFVELGGSTIRTVLTIMNPHDEEVTVNFFFTSTTGEASNFGTWTVPPKGHFSRFLTDDPYNILTDTSGALTFDTSMPVAVAGFHTFSNEAGNFLISREPIADPYATTNTPVTIPTFADSLGWSTQVVLVNTTEDTMSGQIQFFGADANGQSGPIDVTTGDLINGLVTQSAYPYEIPPRTATRITTSNSGTEIVSGFVKVTPDAGTMTPLAYSRLSFTEGSTTDVQTTVDAEVPKASFRLYAERTGDFLGQEALSIRTAVGFANPSGTPSTVRLDLTNLDGSATGISAQVEVPANGVVSRFLDEIPGLEGIPNPFAGIIKATVIQGSPVAATAMRTRIKEFGGFLATTTGPIPDASGAGSTVIFPHIAEGGGYTTEFILISPSGGQASAGVLSFVGTEGQPMNLAVH